MEKLGRNLSEKTYILQIRFNILVGQIRRINLLKIVCKKRGKTMSGKYGLNSWVNNLKENWVEKLVGKLCEKM